MSSRFEPIAHCSLVVFGEMHGTAARPGISPRGLRFHDLRDENGFDGEYDVGTISASLPIC